VKVEITDRATADLREIGRWIARDNRPRSLTFVGELRERCRAIGSRPRTYPLLQGFESEGIRRCNHRSYLIFYRIEEDKVRILHVMHGARDWAVVLTEGE
jgi:addiction module RelE/StbE family toxin